MNRSSEKKSRYKAFALPAGFSGCAFWRYRLPFKKLNSLKSWIDIAVADNPDKMIRMEDIQKHIQDSDLVTLQSPGYRDSFTLIKLYKSEGKKVVIDYDDYSFDLSAGNPRYNELGIEEREILGADGKPIFRWRDQENGFDLKANREKYAAFKMCVENADLITTTTDYLAGKFRKHNPNVAVCPNSIDFDLWRPIPRPKALNNQVRIGWFGGDSHYVDLKVFKGLLPRLVAKYPQAKIVFQAPPLPQWGEFFRDIPPDRIEWHSWADLRYYTLMLASRHWDIGLCPLEDNDFNRCKSSIKFYEFAAIGAAVVAQNMLPYSEDIKDGENGLLASTEDEWFEKISKLVEDVQFRNRLAMNGYQYVKKHRNLDQNCRIWEREFINLIEGKPCGSLSERSFQPSPQK